MNIPTASRHNAVTQLAFSIARQTENEDASMQKLEGDTIDIASIQSDQGLDGILGHLTSPEERWQAEQQGVLRDIAAAVSHASGQAAADFKLQMLGNADRSCHIYHGRAVAEAPDGGLRVFNVGLHDTPGFPGGLLVVAPMSKVEMEDYRGLSEDSIRGDLARKPWMNLGALEQGWKLGAVDG